MANGAQARKPLWRSASGLSAIAAVITALVSAGGFAIAALGGDGEVPPPVASPSASASPSSPGSGTQPAPPVERVLYEDSLADRSAGWTLLDGSDCFSAFAPSGFRLEVDTTSPSICTVQATFRPELVTLSDVRVEVEAEWIRLPSEGDARGLGAAGLRCRGVGRAGDGSFYTAVVSDEGWWSIDRWDGAQGDPDRTGPPSTVLAEGEYPPGAWALGDAVRLALECSEREDGLVVSLSIGDRQVGAAVDHRPLPPGDVGLAAYSFVGPMEVEFRELVVVELAGGSPTA